MMGSNTFTVPKGLEEGSIICQINLQPYFKLQPSELTSMFILQQNSTTNGLSMFWFVYKCYKIT